MKGIFARYSTQIFFVMLILGLVPTIGIMIFLYTEETSIKEAELSKSLLFTSESVSNKISNWIEERELNIIDIATSKLMVESTHEITQISVDERRRSELGYTFEKISNIVMNNQHWIKELVIIDSVSNKIVYHSDLYLPKNLPQERHYLDALEGHVGMSEIHRSPKIIENEIGEYQKDLPTMWFSFPIKGEVGIKGILSVRADVFQIDTAPLFGSVGAEDFDVYVVNSDGNVITKPTLSQTTNQKINSNRYTDLRLINQESNEFTKIFQMANNEKTTWLLEPYQNHFGDMVIGSISPIKNTDWYVVSELNAHTAFSNILKTQIILITFTILLILTIIGLMTYFTTKLIMPLKELEKVTRQIEKGNLEVKVEIEGPTEIKNLSHSFAAMVGSLKNSILSQIDAERKYRTLYEQAPTMNRSIDTTGIIIDCNDMYVAKLGYKKEEIIGKSIFEFYDKTDLPKMQETFEEWKRTGVVFNREIRLKAKDGNLFPVIMNASNLYDKDGNIVGSNTILQDLSDLKKMELELFDAQERAKRSKLVAIGELASRVAHDIRNPLSVIKAQVSVLQFQLPNQQNDESFSRIERAIRRITHQIDHVLDFIKDKNIESQECKILNILKNSIDSMNIPTTVDVHLPDNDMTILCDPNQIEVVCTNLILNAVQAMDEAGSIYIGLQDEKEQIILEFEDSGKGIPPEYLPKLFEPLFTTKQEGTGLGLLSCKNIIEKHGGTISVKLQPTRFIVTLPKKPKL